MVQEVDKYFDILKVLEEAGYAGQYEVSFTVYLFFVRLTFQK